MDDILEFKNINVVFKMKDYDVHAVDRVSLSIKRGEVFGVIGESGSGKSVLGLSVIQLLPKTAKVEGEIYFNHKNILPYTKREIRQIRGKQIGLIPQNPSTSLNPVLRIGKQLDETVKMDQNGKQRSLKKRGIELLEQLGLKEAKRNYAGYSFQLSGGMKQRALAAIGIAAKPPFIIADEPTKGLDSITRMKVIELMKKIVLETNATLFLITHDLHVARKLCDRIGVMYAGQVVEIQQTENLFHDAKHPYTQALLQSLPEKGLVPIPGVAPSLYKRQIGCPFQSRCPQVLDRCKTVKPERKLLEDGEVRCHLYDR